MGEYYIAVSGRRHRTQCSAWYTSSTFVRCLL